LIAVVFVALTGFIIHKPLSRVPENSMKFVVGILLTSFGIFWGAEGAGVNWPRHDLSLLAIIPFVSGVSFLLINFLKIRKAQNYSLKSSTLLTFSPPKKESNPIVRLLGGFLYFWFDFIIGDDWRVAVAVVIGLFATHQLGVGAWWLLPVIVASVLVFTLLEASAAKPSDTSL
jgi:hypothetical protein